MKVKTKPSSTKKTGPAKKPEAPRSLGLEELKEVAVRTGIMSGAAGLYTCNHISD